LPLAILSTPIFQVGAAPRRDPEGCVSAARRERIPTEAVTFADLAITAVDQQFALLVARDVTRSADCFGLSGVHRGRPLIAGATNRPAACVRHHMLVLAHVDIPPSSRCRVSRLATPLPNPVIGIQEGRLISPAQTDIEIYFNHLVREALPRQPKHEDRPKGSDAIRDVLDLEEIRSALDGLTQSDLVRLRRAGSKFALKLDYTVDDLISEAVFSAYSGARQCRRDLPILVFLAGAMRSIAWNAKVSSRKAGSEISLDATGTDGHPLVVLKCAAPDAETLVLRADDMARRITALEDLFADDEPALLVIMADLDELSKEEIMAMNEMSETTYNSTRTRIRRKMERRFPNGWTA
jgi:DNA-directed RNA polymerase specialized sigma24 family protein